jgi:hypothetical protein
LKVEVFLSATKQQARAATKQQARAAPRLTIGDFQHGYDHIRISGFGRGSAPLGADRQLAVGHFRDGGIWDGSGLDSADKLFFDDYADTLYYINAMTIDGDAYSLTVTALVKTNVNLATDDLMIV